MTVRFLIAKYAPSLRRMEPRNIGILAFGENDSATKFVGDNKESLPRSLGINDKKTYRRWIATWSRMALSKEIEDGRGEKIPRSSSQFFDAFRTYARGNYILVDGGIIDDRPGHKTPTPSTVINYLFEELVGHPQSKRSLDESKRVAGLSQKAMRLAGVLERDDLLQGAEVVYKPFGAKDNHWRKTRMSASDHAVVMCRIAFELTDGQKIYNLEKTFRLPCWLQEGMRLDLGLWAWPQVSYVTTNPRDCTQTAMIKDSCTCEPHQLASVLEQWINDGWVVESEDSYT